MWRFRFSFVPCSLLLLLVFLLSGGCSSTPQSCKNKDDCLDGQVCRKQICIQSSSKGCLRNSDCQGGRVCELTTGLCVECLQDKDCDLGRQCLGQRCQSGGADGGVEQAGLPESSAESLVCKTDADCPSDQKCDIVSGQCIPKQGSQCKTDNE